MGGCLLPAFGVLLGIQSVKRVWVLGVAKDNSVSVVLLAGGKGKRMGVIAKHAQVLSSPSRSTYCPVECLKLLWCANRDVSEDASGVISVDLKFALPGKERQDSVFSGLQLIKDASMTAAAVLGVPVKATIKEANSGSFVVKTLHRKTLWEMQTPRVIRPQLRREGFDLENRKGLEVTDDVSIVEYLKHLAYITEGSYTKVTTPDDLLLAEKIVMLAA